jgi:hypothetical protein
MVIQDITFWRFRGTIWNLRCSIISGLHFALHVPSNSPNQYPIYAQVCRVLMVVSICQQQKTFALVCTKIACTYRSSGGDIILPPPCGQCEFDCQIFSAVITTFLALPLSSVKRLNALTCQPHPPLQLAPPRKPSSAVGSVLRD